ncbi:GMP synthase [glutamine-hydrolyzing] subunit A [uncultured archaeon]|nr:GMP synthase [glutamine-hydrolyzing] subunit A [uncultured archaeon]
MILLLDLCYERDSLSKYEFVNPVADTLRKAEARFEILHFTEIAEDELGKYDKIILCGTALKDNTYAGRIDVFSWLKRYERPALGICAGMQVIGAVYGGSIVPRPAIGLERIEIVTDTPLLGEPRQIEGYHLHNYGVTLPEEFLLVSGTTDVVEAFKHRERPIYGIIFHPEVRNRWILERFAGLHNSF